MKIYKTNDTASDCKLYDYSEIKKVTFVQDQPDEKKQNQEEWSFEFRVYTDKRDFVLYASTHDERTLWVHTFYWITILNQPLNNDNKSI